MVLDELEFLASVEHALTVEYLTIGYALAADLPDASVVAASLGQSQMFRLHRLCRALVAAGRSPSLDRAASITADLLFSPVGPDAYANLLHRESAIARAVDDRYRALAPSAGPELAELIGESGPTHEADLQPLRDAIGDPAPPGLLHTVRFEPRDDTESLLLSASDSAYRVVVTALRAMYGDDFGSYRSIANTSMMTLDAINQVMARTGLLPSFNP
ncbi:hypothetical protein AB0M02_36115 [Actinoplanes sp. NPDC051861]|uniref:hypothetical protein n=1 Tax=Actinoplanes sp. NPDC051861 TaxID=3155170 RepID=UPI00341DF568